jgi:UDP-3-O-[3-hydroxymyristoyl] glucosamine N-acyltransferase
VFGEAVVRESATISGHAHIKGNSHIYGEAIVRGNAVVGGTSKVDRKAIITDKAEVSNAVISGSSTIEGASKISKGCEVYGMARILNSTLKTRVSVFDQVFVDGSVLDGTIILVNSAKVSHSDLEGENIKVGDDSVVHSVKMVGVTDVRISDHAVLALAMLNGVSQMTMKDNAEIAGDSVDNRVYLVGKNLSFSGMCRIGEGVEIHGKLIVIANHARLAGKIRVGSNVTLSEFAEIENIKPDATKYVINDTEMSMDNSIIL